MQSVVSIDPDSRMSANFREEIFSGNACCLALMRFWLMSMPVLQSLGTDERQCSRCQRVSIPRYVGFEYLNLPRALAWLQNPKDGIVVSFTWSKFCEQIGVSYGRMGFFIQRMLRYAYYHEQSAQGTGETGTPFGSRSEDASIKNQFLITAFHPTIWS